MHIRAYLGMQNQVVKVAADVIEGSCYSQMWTYESNAESYIP